jgi:aarF domain-containing kinase
MSINQRLVMLLRRHFAIPHQARIPLLGAILGGASLITALNFDARQFGNELTRTGRTFFATGAICLDYRCALNAKRSLDESHVRSANRLHQLFSRNGGLYVKLGQHLSGLDHVIPKPYTQVMATLQDQAPAHPIDQINRVFREDLGADIDDIFSEFNPVPLGTASIGQVHVARLRSTGELVAVKIQHATLKRDSVSDLRAFRATLGIIRVVFPQFEFNWLANEIDDCLQKELDFRKEAENADRLRYLLKRHQVKGIKIPRLYHNLCSRRILIMEYCPGSKITDTAALLAQNIDPLEVTKAMWRMLAAMVFDVGFLHCDLHPGNVLVQVNSDGKGWSLVLLDHGIYEEVPRSAQLIFAELFVAAVKKDLSVFQKFAEELGLPADAFTIIFGLISKGSPDSKMDLAPLRQASLAKSLNKSLLKLPRSMLAVIHVCDKLKSNERALRSANDSLWRPSLAIPILWSSCNRLILTAILNNPNATWAEKTSARYELYRSDLLSWAVG